MKLPCFLALDIGTEAVKALVFERANNKYYILGGALEYFDALKPFDRDKVVSRAKEEAVAMSGISPKDLLLSLPANILRSRIDFQSVCRRNPKEVINKEEEKNTHQCVFKKAGDKIAEHFSRKSGILPQDIHFVKFEILETKIDGYQTPGLAGYGGQNLEFRILASFLPSDYLNNAGRIAAKLGIKLQEIVNPISALPGILEVSQGIFLDIGGEVTQICLVRNRHLDFIDEFGRGGSDFTRAISETLGMRLADAEILKENYSRGELTEGARKRVKEILFPASREWLLGLESRLKDAKGLIPRNFFLLGGGSQLPEIEELIGATAKEIKLIYPKSFENIIDSTRCVNGPQFINSILLFYGQEKNF